MNKRSYGFTLIELLVVIAIISLLSSVVLASLKSVRVKARDARRAADMEQIKLALELYADRFGFLPKTSNYPVVGYACADFGDIDMSSQSCFMPFLASSSIMAKVPVDPVNNNTTGSQCVLADGYSYGYYCYYPGEPSNPMMSENTAVVWWLSESTGLCMKTVYISPAPCK
jgi:prepilin-type N-terminal cleavage/methylation domain-containing protein